MRIALLTTDPKMADWFVRDYPQVSLCEQVNDEFWEAECMIIQSYYRIGDLSYQILNLWEKYLRIRHKRKKLIVIGTSSNNSLNYLQVSAMPELSTSWARDVRRAGAKSEKPTYPKLPDEDIIEIIGRFLHSHGVRAFQKLLNEVQGYLRRIERAIKNGDHRESVQAMPEMNRVKDLMDITKGVWEDKKGFFSLMPQYRELKTFEHIWTSWEKIRDYSEAIDPKLSQQISQYAMKTIVDIVRFYKMESTS